MTARRAVCFAAWCAWLLWVVLHSFRIPGDWFVAFNGPWPSVGGGAAPALARAARALAGAAVVVVAAWGLGSLVARRAFGSMFDAAIERLSFELALGFAVLSYTLLALAFVGLYRPAVVEAVTAAAAIGGVFALRRPRLAPGRAWFDLWPVAACALLACGFAFVGALAPESEYDALGYHLWLPMEWLRAGRAVDLVTEFSSLYPLTWELLYGAATALGGPIAAKLLHWLCLPLVGAAAFQLTQRAAPDASPVVAAALAMTPPIVIWEATSAYIDLALAWYIALAVHALVRHDATRQRRWLVLAALMLGVALAIKHLALFALLIAAAILLVRQLRAGGLTPALRTTTLFVVISLTAPLPWYARAYAASGNPVFPELYHVFGARPAARWDEPTDRRVFAFQEYFGRPRTARSLLLLPWDITVHAARYGGTLGPTFLVLLPALAFGRRPRGGAVAAIGIGCAAYVACWASPVSSFQMRFLVPIVPLVAMLGAEAASRLADGSRTLRFAVAGIVALLLAMDLPPAVEWHERDRRGWDGWLTHVMRGAPAAVVVGRESESEYLARMVPAYRAWTFVNARLPPDARVLTFSAGDQLYGNRARVWSDAAAARPILDAALASDRAQVLGAARAQRITHVLVDKRGALRDERAARIAGDDMLRCCERRLYEDDRFALYEIDDAAPRRLLSANNGVK